VSSRCSPLIVVMQPTHGRHIFTERVPELVAPYARKTYRGNGRDGAMRHNEDWNLVKTRI
jgi:hypothetical protein